MARQIPRPMGSIVLVTTLLLWAVGMGGSADTARADDCLAAPNSPTPKGSHWYYRFDPANQRKCWYLRATDQPAQHTATQGTSDTASPPATTALEKPATDLTNAPTSIRPADTAVPLPRVKPQRAPVSTATTAEPAQKGAKQRKSAPSTKPAAASATPPTPTAPADSTAPPLRGVIVQTAPMGGATTNPSVQPSAENESAVPSITNPLAAQLRLSPQINEQGVVPAASTASPAWPNPPTGGDTTQEPTAPQSEARVDAVQPTKDAKAPNDVEGNAQAGTSITNAGVTSTPVAVFPLVALGLVVAGFLLRIVVKKLVGRRHRIAVDHRINDSHAQKSPDDQIVGQGDGLSDYLQRSSRAVASKSGPRRPSQVSDDRLNDAPDTAPLRMDKLSKLERRPTGVDRSESERIDDKRQQRKWRNDEKRHESPSIDLRQSERIDDHHPQGWRDDRHQHRSVGKGDELINDLQSSLVAAGNDHTRSALQDGSPNDGGGRAAASANEIREREEGLEQLRRSLDRLLQSPNVA